MTQLLAGWSPMRARVERAVTSRTTPKTRPCPPARACCTCRPVSTDYDTAPSPAPHTQPLSADGCTAMKKLRIVT